MTIIALTIITILIMLLALACERIGYWKQEARRATFRRKWIDWLVRDGERKQAAINEWRMAANVLMEDNKALEAGNRYLRARGQLVRTAWWRRRQKRSLYPTWVVLARLP